MSLILDALKKSEAERMRGQAPTLLSPLPALHSHSRTSEKSRLPLLLLIAFVLTALIIGYFYSKKQPVISSDIVIEAANQTTGKALAVIDPPVIALAPKPATIEAAVVPTVIAPTPAPAAPVMATSNAPEIRETAPVIAETAPAVRIASLAELSIEQRQQLPTLKLSMHVYSQEASKRFAIIDGQRVNEGSVLGTAVVEQIRQDGVVLSLQGQSYLLPRP